MNNALLYLGGILVAALAVLFAAPYFVDWNRYRGVFEEEATRVLGREVRVGGAVNLRLLPAPYVRFDKIRIADSGSEGGSSIFRAESFTMWLSVPPLLRGVLEAHQVQLKRPVVQLAVDRNGSGNWRTLAINPGVMPFVPRDVALQSVNVFEGLLVVSGANREELARFESINGELAAEAIEGPYKFRGTLNWSDRPREVRVVTARQDPGGEVRFKASVDAPDSGNSYVLDGRVSDLGGTPRVEGELTAKLDFALKTQAPLEASGSHSTVQEEPELSIETPGPGTAPPPELAAPVPGEHPRFDLRAKLSGDTKGVDLSDLAVTLEQGGPPQLITGAAKVAWADRTHIDVALASRWLDLDRLIGGAKTDLVPLAAARGYFEALAAALPTEADTNATLEFDQLNLGGEVVSGVRLAATRTNGPLELKGVRASLPGGARLELDGVLTPGAQTPKLRGTMWLSGQSLMRFLAWGFRETTIGTGRSDGPFALEGKLTLGDSAIELAEAAAEFSGMQLSGDVKLGLGARNRLAMTLEGSRADLNQIQSGVLDLGLLEGVFFAGAAPPTGENKEADAPGGPRFLDPAGTDLALKLKFSEVIDGTRELRNVEAELSVERGKLAMPVLRFSTPEGLLVEAEGDAVDVPVAPKGAIRLLVAAPGREAAEALISLLDLPEEMLADAKPLTNLAPFRVAGTLDFRARSEKALDLTLDGAMQGGRVRAVMKFDGGRESWRSEAADISMMIDSPSVERLLATIVDAPPRPAADAIPKPGRVVVKAAGIPADDVVSMAAITADGLKLDYRGRLKLPAPGAAQLTGTLRVDATDARTVLMLAGVRLADGAAGVPLAGTIALSADSNRFGLEAEELNIGESKVRGQLSLAQSDAKRRVLTAELQADTATLSGLLAPILGQVAVAPAPAPPPSSGQAQGFAPLPSLETQPIWPEQPFDLSGLEQLDAQVKARFGVLAVEPGLGLSGARLSATLGERGIEIDALEGNALGGRLTSSYKIEKAAAGVVFNGSVKVAIAGAGRSSGATAGESAAGDAISFATEFSGRGLSPGALIADVEGKGEIAVGDATLTGMSPAAVTAVVENALGGKGPAGGEALVEALKGALKQGELKLGSIKVPVAIRDGAMRLDRVRIESAEGRATFATVLELATMKIDSEWQIEPKISRGAGADGARTFLPAISVVYVGKVSELATLEPRVATGALERELQVRKMERDVEELERLRKLDQMHAGEEQERQKALEAERAKANSPVTQGGAPPSPPHDVPPAEAPEQVGGTTSTLPADGDGTQGEAPQEPAVPGTTAATSTSAAAAQPVPGEAGAVPVQPDVATPRPARKRKPPEDDWRPFQSTPF